MKQTRGSHSHWKWGLKRNSPKSVRAFYPEINISYVYVYIYIAFSDYHVWTLIIKAVYSGKEKHTTPLHGGICRRRAICHFLWLVRPFTKLVAFKEEDDLSQEELFEKWTLSKKKNGGRWMTWNLFSLFLVDGN